MLFWFTIWRIITNRNPLAHIGQVHFCLDIARIITSNCQKLGWSDRILYFRYKLTLRGRSSSSIMFENWRFDLWEVCKWFDSFTALLQISFIVDHIITNKRNSHKVLLTRPVVKAQEYFVIVIATGTFTVVEIQASDSFHFTLCDFADLTFLIFATKNVKPILKGYGTTAIYFSLFAIHGNKLRVQASSGINKNRNIDAFMRV